MNKAYDLCDEADLNKQRDKLKKLLKSEDDI